MKLPVCIVVLLIISAGCARWPSLPAESRFNVTATLNDSAWYGTGRILLLKEQDQSFEDIRSFNLLVSTDIDYPGMENAPNPKTDNGCTDPQCTKSQSLLIYNVPLRKGRSRISRLDKRSPYKHEVAGFTYVGNSGGMEKHYTYQGLRPGRIRVTRFDKASGWVEGCFSVAFSKDTRVKDHLSGKVPDIAHFRNGLFRIRITDVYLPGRQSRRETD